MRWTKRLGLKLYAFFFAWIAMGQLISLTSPDAEPFVYYHTMEALAPAASVYYTLALVSAVLTILSLIPLFFYAFNEKPQGALFFKTLFWARAVAESVGHNYDIQFLRAWFNDAPPLAIAMTVVIIVLTLVPSYRAHYRYAFQK